MPATEATTQSKRDEILEIASRLFYEQGFGATGIKQIIEEAGIAKGTFYTHFKSKDELGLAWLKARHETWSRWLREATAEVEGAEKILRIFDFLEEWLKDSGYRGCAFLNTKSEIPEQDNLMCQEVVAHKQGLLDQFKQMVAEHFETTETSASQDASIIFILFEGALVEAQNFHDSWPIRSARKHVAEILAR